MAGITLTGTPADTSGELPAEGGRAPDFVLVRTDLSEITLADYAGRQLLLNIFLSVDTDICPHAVRRFDAEAARRRDTVVLCVSADLPFALKRFLGTEHLEAVEAASCFRYPAFARDYGVGMVNGPLQGMLARAVLVIDKQGIVRHSQLVREINDQPDYEAALAALDKAAGR